MPIVIFILLAVLAGPAYSREGYTFAQLDSITYHYYETKQWEPLQKWGQKMLQSGYDYYYLRMRMGIVAYDKKLYSLALPHFQKAAGFQPDNATVQEYIYYSYYYTHQFQQMEKYARTLPQERVRPWAYATTLEQAIALYNQRNFTEAQSLFDKALTYNPSAPLPKEYRYYCLIFTGQTDEAHVYAATLSHSLQKKLKTSPSGIEEVTVEGGTSFSNHQPSLENKDVKGDAKVYGESTYQMPNSYFSMGLGIRVASRYKISFQIADFYTPTSGVVQSNRWNGISWTPQQSTFDAHNHQQQYTLGFTQYWGNGWKTGIYGGIYQVNYTQYAGIYQPLSLDYKYFTNQSSQTQWAVGASISKRFAKVEPSVSMSLSKLNNKNQVQGILGLTYYPWGTTKWYGHSFVSFAQNGDQSQWVLGQKLGTWVAPQWNLEAFGAAGNLSNFVGISFSQTFNTADPIRYLWGGGLKWQGNPFGISLVYSGQAREANYTSFVFPNTSTSTTYLYNLHYLILTLSCKF